MICEALCFHLLGILHSTIKYMCISVRFMLLVWCLLKSRLTFLKTTVATVNWLSRIPWIYKYMIERQILSEYLIKIVLEFVDVAFCNYARKIQPPCLSISCTSARNFCIWKQRILNNDKSKAKYKNNVLYEGMHTTLWNNIFNISSNITLRIHPIKFRKTSQSP